MRFLSSCIKKYWPIGVLLTVSLVLFITNWTPNTWLIGWDNINPEFNFPVNLARSFFGVWQEYRGLGLYDGMSHIANLVHTLFLWSLSFVLPTNLLRYVFTFFMHFVGGIGAYILIESLFTHSHTHHKKFLGLLGALFYLLNIATVQMFFTPLEAFSVHFAALPWLAWSFLQYLQKPSRGTFSLLLLITVFSTPQFFVPTFLLPVGLLLVGIAITQLIIHKASIRHILTAVAGFLIVNLFWLLPYVWGLPHNAPVITNAKINQMSDAEIYAQNQQFGDLKDVLLLRGFSLNYQDLGANDKFSYMMDSWRYYIDMPFVQILAGAIATITLLGLVAALRKPKQRPVGFVILFILCFILLGNDIPGVKNVMSYLQQTVPFFKEALRIPFTKFSLLFALSYTVLFVTGVSALIRTEKNDHVNWIFLTGLVTVIIILSLPAYSGNFIYKNLRIAIPDEYTQLFNFMNHQDPSSRIAILPQPDYWSWKYYRFGYRGSGFLWFGLPQALLDRAFDPWSNTSENYYWELSHALFAKDGYALDEVFRKYDVGYILLDGNQRTTGNNRALFMLETKALLATMPTVRTVKNFGNLTLYSVDEAPKSFVSIKENLPTVYPTYQWTDNDVAYQELGDYVSTNNQKQAIYGYPFRSLFTKRSADEREFMVTENDKFINIISNVEATSSGLSKQQNLVYDSTKTDQLIASSVQECGVLDDGVTRASNEIESDAPFLHLEALNQRNCLSFGIDNILHKNGYIAAVESKHETGRPLQFSLINETAKHTEVETLLPTDTQWKTTYFIIPPLANDGLGYSVYITNDAIGRYPSVNDVRRIRIYEIPYDEMVNMKSATESQGFAAVPGQPLNDIRISHPNPSYYKVSLTENGSRIKSGMTNTLILSQSFNPGWLAVTATRQFPYLKPAGMHVLVNNWENGWTLDATNPMNIYIFFWPQILEWVGFLLIPIPFFVAWKMKR